MSSEKHHSLFLCYTVSQLKVQDCVYRGVYVDVVPGAGRIETVCCS